MKRKIFTIVVLMIMTITVSAQKWVSLGGSEDTKCEKQLITATDDKVSVSVKINGFYQTTVKMGNEEAYVIESPEMVSMLLEGCPDVPMFAIPVIIGDDNRMGVNVTVNHFVDFENVNIAPSKGNLLRTVNPDDVAYKPGKQYQVDAFYPAQQASLQAPYILRDFRAQNIMVMPFAYNPVTKVLRVFDDLTIEMTTLGHDGLNAFKRKSNVIKVNQDFAYMYQQHFINFGSKSTTYTFVPDEGSMLVICYDNFMQAMQPYVDWKNISGRKTVMVGTSTTGTTDVNIRTYIEDYYEAHPDLIYVLLVGDLEQVTSHYDYSAMGRTDNWYARIVGTDDYSDLLVGRFSCENVTHVQTQVNKVINYERDLDETATWLSTAIGVGANEGAGSGHDGGEADYVHIGKIRDTLLAYTYTNVFEEYKGIGSGTSATKISSDLNGGSSLLNYCNHGSETSWSVANYSASHVNALTNDYKLPIVWATACLNGKFDVTCFAETWMRATNNSTGAPTGAIGTMMSWISQPWQPPMTGQDEMVNILVENVSPSYRHTLGGASLNGAAKILDLHPSDNGSTYKTWILFGDPSLICRTMTPSPLSVTPPQTIILGSSNINVTVADAENALATLSIGNRVLGSAFVQGGIANINIDDLDTLGMAKLIIVAYNKVTYVNDIQVVEGNNPFVVLDAFEVNDAQENNNQSAEYGENVYLNLNLKNLGMETATNVSVRLSGSDQYVLCDTTSTLNVSSMAHNAVVTLNDAFYFQIADTVPDAHKAIYRLIATNGTDTWEMPLVLNIAAPNLNLLNEYTVTGSNGETVLNAGNLATINVTIENKGHAAIENLSVQAFSDDIMISTGNYSNTVAELAAGATVEVPLYVSVHPACEINYQAALTIVAQGGYDNYFSDQINLPLTVGEMLSYNMTSGFVTTDNGYFYDSGGASADYSEYESSVMVFTPASADMMLSVTFTDFHVESYYDYLKIFDGSSTDAPLLGKFEGNNPIGTFTATNDAGALTFMFSSDYTQQYSGWEAVIKAVYMGQPYVEAMAENPICRGERQLYAKLHGIDASQCSFQWYPSVYLTDAGSAMPTAFNPITTTFSVVVITPDSLILNDSVTIFVEPLFENMPVEDVVLCKSTNDVISLDATSEGAVSYFWSPANETSPNITINSADYELGDYEFSVTMTDERACSYVHTFTVSVKDCTSIDEVYESKISVYPNPANDVLNISLKDLASSYTYKVYNVNGQVVAESASEVSAENNRISLQGFSSGLYLLRINIDNVLVTKKIMIQ